jgi:hypothetical protein
VFLGVRLREDEDGGEEKTVVDAQGRGEERRLSAEHWHLELLVMMVVMQSKRRMDAFPLLSARQTCEQMVVFMLERLRVRSQLALLYIV